MVRDGDGNMRVHFLLLGADEGIRDVRLLALFPADQQFFDIFAEICEYAR